MTNAIADKALQKPDGSYLSIDNSSANIADSEDLHGFTLLESKSSELLYVEMLSVINIDAVAARENSFHKILILKFL